MILYNKHIYGRITRFLYNYETYIEAFKDKEDAIIEGKSYRITNNSWIKSKNKKSNTLEEQAIELAEIDSNRDKKMLDAISKVITVLEKEDKIKHKVLGMKYFQQKQENDILKELNIERTWYYQKCTEILNLIAFFAIANRSYIREGII